ncbi:MAG: hypothetical protein CMJ58_20565 [Planctomycetaceae bacterium]|nr:hypothetical protein [Planctomycetaceae bacterium]
MGFVGRHCWFAFVRERGAGSCYNVRFRLLVLLEFMLELVLYIVVFIGLSGLMAAVEAAVMNVSRVEVEELQAQGAWGAGALKAITDRITRPVVVLVIFTNTINILGPILCGQKATDLYGDTVLGVVVAVLTFGTIVFSEIIPKSLGSHYAPTIARVAAPLIRFFVAALYPVVVALDWFSNLLMRGERRIGTEQQIRSLAKIGHKEGYIEPNEGRLLQRAFLLNDRSAADIMTPRDRMIMIPATATVREAATQIFRHAYSRYPVYDAAADKVTALVMSRDVLEAISNGRDQEPITAIARDVLVVPADMRSDHLLVRFRNERVHLAVVQAEGQVEGLVTLEDVLEELVGEIEDEKDRPPAPPSMTRWRPSD